MSTLVNGEPSSSIDIHDRGLAYGDGVFRTLSLVNGKCLNWQRHYFKLEADCIALNIRCPSQQVLLEDIATIKAEEDNCIIKIIVTRGIGERGYAPPAVVEPARMMLTSAVPVYPEHYISQGVTAILCTIRLASQPCLAGIKHLNRLENVLARAEWDDPGVAEGLLLDCNGNLIEGTRCNIFMLLDSVLYTPDLSRCGVAGLERERIMELAHELGIKLLVRALPLHYLIQAEVVLLCNSLIGVWQITSFLKKTWPVGKFTPMIRDLLTERTLET